MPQSSLGFFWGEKNFCPGSCAKLFQCKTIFWGGTFFGGNIFKANPLKPQLFAMGQWAKRECVVILQSLWFQRTQLILETPWAVIETWPIGNSTASSRRKTILGVWVNYLSKITSVCKVITDMFSLQFWVQLGVVNCWVALWRKVLGEPWAGCFRSPAKRSFSTPFSQFH